MEYKEAKEKLDKLIELEACTKFEEVSFYIEPAFNKRPQPTIHTVCNHINEARLKIRDMNGKFIKADPRAPYFTHDDIKIHLLSLGISKEKIEKWALYKGRGNRWGDDTVLKFIQDNGDYLNQLYKKKDYDLSLFLYRFIGNVS